MAAQVSVDQQQEWRWELEGYSSGEGKKKIHKPKHVLDFWKPRVAHYAITPAHHARAFVLLHSCLTLVSVSLHVFGGGDAG